MLNWHQQAALGRNERAWMFLRIFSLCSSSLAISASSQAPLLSNLVSPRETGFAAVSDHLGTHQQSKYQMYFVRKPGSCPSPF